MGGLAVERQDNLASGQGQETPHRALLQAGHCVCMSR